MFVQLNIEVLSYNHHCNGKATCMIYYERVFAVLGIQHAVRMRHIVICGMLGCTILFNITS